MQVQASDTVFRSRAGGKIVSNLTRVNHGSAWDRRRAARKNCSDIIRRYRSGQSIPEHMATQCALDCAELLTICEMAMKASKKQGARK
jgi:hypothetical protein